MPNSKKAGISNKHCKRRSKKTLESPLSEKASGEHLIFTNTELPEENPCITPVRDFANIPQSIEPSMTCMG